MSRRSSLRPTSPEMLVSQLVDWLATHSTRQWLRVGVDGPPAAEPDRLAAELIDPLRARGRAALRVSMVDFLRPASVRLEQGRTNPESYYSGWFDEAGLRREVLDPLGPGGTGRIVPSLRDAATDRASRAPYLSLPADAIVLVSGPLLLGSGLSFDATVHLAMSAAALARRTHADQHWTLPAFARYQDEVAPDELADVLVRVDDPRHPAVLMPGDR